MIRKKYFLIALVLFFSVVVFTKTLDMRYWNMNRCRFSRRGFGRGRNRGRCCCRMQCQGRPTNGSRMFKRDGTGSHKDGKGPRGCNMGPREDCPCK